MAGKTRRRRKIDLDGLKPNPFANFSGERLQPTPSRRCGICGKDVTKLDMRDHLLEFHPAVTPEMYFTEYPDGMPIVIDMVTTARSENPDPPLESVLDLRLALVTDDEAKAHPGGREAAQIEKTIEEAERKAYHEDVLALLSNGYPPSFEVATTAYNMLQVRRVRSTIEQARSSSGERYVDTDYLDLLAAMENRTREGIKLLERIKAEQIKQQPTDDPSKLIATELAEAERWIQGHIGEFTERCPKCGDLVTPPNLPHWAFERIETAHGPAWPVWSRELWELVMDKVIHAWEMAYVLRTSIEGLRQTCGRRGDTWPEWIVISEQERLLGQRLLRNDQKTLVGDFIT